MNALSDLRGSLDPHLHREEDDMVAIVATTLTARQFSAGKRRRKATYPYYGFDPRVSRQSSPPSVTDDAPSRRPSP